MKLVDIFCVLHYDGCVIHGNYLSNEKCENEQIVDRGGQNEG